MILCISCLSEVPFIISDSPAMFLKTCFKVLLTFSAGSSQIVLQNRITFSKYILKMFSDNIVKLLCLNSLKIFPKCCT